jgi:hypothetical protein
MTLLSSKTAGDPRKEKIPSSAALQGIHSFSGRLPASVAIVKAAFRMHP